MPKSEDAIPLDRIADLERRVADLERRLAGVGHPDHVRAMHLAEMAEPRPPRE